jgi:predicted transcriptional regulator
MNATISLSPSVSAIVDELGAIDTEIKRLTKQKEALATQVKAEGNGRFSGAIYEGLVYTSEGRISTDWEAIAAKFSPSRQLIAAHTKQGAPIVSLKLSKV